MAYIMFYIKCYTILNYNKLCLKILIMSGNYLMLLPSELKMSLLYHFDVYEIDIYIELPHFRSCDCNIFWRHIYHQNISRNPLKASTSLTLPDYKRVVCDTIDRFDRETISAASKSGYDVIVKKIMSRNKRELGYDVALRNAIEFGHLEVVKLIYENKVSLVNLSIMMESYRIVLYRGPIEVIKYFYSKKIDFPDITERDRILKSNLETTSQLETVKFLLSIPEYEYLSLPEDNSHVNDILEQTCHSGKNYLNIIYFLDYLFTKNIRFDEDIIIRIALDYCETSSMVIKYLSTKYNLNQEKYYRHAMRSGRRHGLRYLIDKYTTEGIKIDLLKLSRYEYEDHKLSDDVWSYLNCIMVI